MAGINAAIIKQTLVMALQASAAGVAFFTRLTKNIERKMIPKTTIVPNRIYVISMIKLLCCDIIMTEAVTPSAAAPVNVSGNCQKGIY